MKLLRAGCVCFKHESRTGLDRSQTLLFPERLEDYIAQENPVRFFDAFVGSLDLDEEQKQISITDADARKMHTAQGSVVGYNTQTAVDAKNKLIAAADVTNDVADYRQLANIALEAKETLQVQQTEVVADKGYYNAAEVSRCVDKAEP